jgi:hypothetical protein
MIDVYSASEVKREFWLTDREKEFFIATIIHINNGYFNPIGEESLQIYKKYFSPTTNNPKISDYLNRIRKKCWVKYDKEAKVVEIPLMFQDINTSSDVITFNLRYAYEQIDRRDTE